MGTEISLGLLSHVRERLLQLVSSFTDKDVSRTDRTHCFYSEANHSNVKKLYDILLTYCMYNFDLGKFNISPARNVIYVSSLLFESLSLFQRTWRSSSKEMHDKNCVSAEEISCFNLMNEWESILPNLCAHFFGLFLLQTARYFYVLGSKEQEVAVIFVACSTIWRWRNFFTKPWMHPLLSRLRTRHEWPSFSNIISDGRWSWSFLVFRGLHGKSGRC